MSLEDIRIECLRLALECREAGQGPAEMIAIAAALESYVAPDTAAVGAPSPGRARKASARAK